MAVAPPQGPREAPHATRLLYEASPCVQEASVLPGDGSLGLREGSCSSKQQHYELLWCVTCSVSHSQGQGKDGGAKENPTKSLRRTCLQPFVLSGKPTRGLSFRWKSRLEARFLLIIKR